MEAVSIFQSFGVHVSPVGIRSISPLVYISRDQDKHRATVTAEGSGGK